MDINGVLYIATFCLPAGIWIFFWDPWKWVAVSSRDLRIKKGGQNKWGVDGDSSQNCDGIWSWWVWPEISA